MNVRSVRALVVAGACLIIPPSVLAQVKVVSLAANDLVYDSVSDRIYVAVPGRSAVWGNRVVIVDPETAAIDGSIFVGSEPSVLALSDDGQFLYVGLLGAGSIVQVELSTQSVVREFFLGTLPFYGTLFAEDIAVQPGNPEVIAVSQKSPFVSPRHVGVAIFDAGVRRANSTAVHTGANRIEFDIDPGKLYGYNNETTEFGFRTMAVDSDGVSVIDIEKLFSGFGVDIEMAGGLVYATTGELINPAAPVRVATFPLVDPTFSRAVAPDVASDRVHYLVASSWSGSVRQSIQSFSIATQTPTSTIPLPAQTVGVPDDLIVWGTGGLAFRTSGDQVVIIPPRVGDSDDDDVDDAIDNCPADSNSAQEDADRDGFGDVCDPFPRQSDNLAACLEAREDDADQIRILTEENALLRERLRDDDGDGIPSFLDTCLQTAAGQVVDSAGCALGEFCTRWQTAVDCNAADWKSDSPSARRDCDWRAGVCRPRTP